MEIDGFHRAILRELQANGRISNRDLAERIHLSTTPCWRRVKELERGGVIQGYRAVLDPMKLGLHVLVLAEVSLDDHHPDTVASFNAAVDHLPEVLECHMVSGAHDFVLKIVAVDMAAYADWLRRHLLQLPGVNRVASTFVMKSLKCAAAYPVDQAG